jgi:hypothetical protein
MNFPKSVQDLIDRSNSLFDIRKDLSECFVRADKILEEAEEAQKVTTTIRDATNLALDKFEKCDAEWRMAKFQATMTLADIAGIKR